MTGDLDAEFASAVTRLHDDSHVPGLLSQGIPRSAIYGVRPLVGVAAVEIDNHGWFQFAEHGELALIIADGVPGLIGWESIDEVVAIRPETQGQWWRATAAVQVFGHGKNTDLIDYKTTLGERIRLYESPHSWLRGGGGGLVILDWTLDPRDHFEGIKLECETPALAAEVRRRAADAAVAAFDLIEVRHGA